MACDHWQQAISARADGEDIGVDPRLLDAHLTACDACCRFVAFTDTSRARARLQPASPMPDMAQRVTRLNAIADRAAAWSVPRVLLVVVAVEIIAFSVRELVLGGDDTAVHATRHLGAFTLAYGVGLLVVAVRPARSRTMLPVAAVLAGALAITAVVDIIVGEVPLIREASHIPELISVVLVWMLAVPSDRRRLRHSPVPALTLRAVPVDPPIATASGDS